MTRNIRVVGALGASIALTFAVSAVTFAAPLYGQPLHYIPQPIIPVSPPKVSGSSTTKNSSSTSATSSGGSVTTKTPPISRRPGPIHAGSSTTGSSNSTDSTTATAEVKEQLQSSQLRTCQDRENVITEIMNRADTRAQNQLALFTNIATNVENFYVSKGKAVSIYGQLVAAVNADETQTSTDLATLKADSTFACNGNNPSGVVSTYRSDLTTVQTDLQNLRNAVKNLIAGVAHAEGYTLPSTTSTTSGGNSNE